MVKKCISTNRAGGQGEVSHRVILTSLDSRQNILLLLIEVSRASTLKRWGEKLALIICVAAFWAPGGNSKFRQRELHQVTKFTFFPSVKTDRFCVHDSYKESRPLTSLVMPLRKSVIKMVHATNSLKSLHRISIESLKFLHKWCIPIWTGKILRQFRTKA